MDAWNLIFVAIVSLFVLIGAVCDYRTKKLPNWLTVPGFALGVLFHLVHGAISGGLSGMGYELVNAMIGFCTGFGILFVLWLIGSGGAGDVKLMGALGAWLGATMTLQVFFVSTVFVMLASVVVLGWAMIQGGMMRTRGKYLSTPQSNSKNSTGVLTADQRVRRRLMPYGVPVAFATWAVLAWTLS